MKITYYQISFSIKNNKKNRGFGPIMQQQTEKHDNPVV